MIKTMIKTMIRVWRVFDLSTRKFWCHRLGHLSQRYGYCTYCFENVGFDVRTDTISKNKDMKEEIERLRAENEAYKKGDAHNGL